MRALPSALTVAAVLLALGCASYDRRAGVSNLWRDAERAGFEDGVTTRADVLAALGPPSQVIGLEDRVVLYYLRERTRGTIQVLLLYNRQSENISYDRAIFFFDPDGVLVEHAFSDEEIPLE